MASTTLQMSAGRAGAARPRVLFLGLLLLTMSRGAAGATWSSPVSGTAAGTSAAAWPSSGAPVSDAPQGSSTAAAGGAPTSPGGTGAAGSTPAASNTGSVSAASAAATPASGATWSPSGGSGMPPTAVTMSSAAMSTATRAVSSASWRPESGSGTATAPAAATAMMAASAGSTSSLSASSSSTATLLASTAASPKGGSTASVATPPATGTTGSPNAASGHPAMTSTPGGGTAGATTTPPMDVDMIYCPVLSCDSSQCHAAYAGRNATPCAAGQWCQLWKMASAYYAANCSASCGGGCADADDAHCAVACCNATGCLADAFASLAAATSAEPAPGTVAMTATPTRRATTANGRKCHRGTCTGATCYTGFRDALQTCSAAQPHCQLMKQTVQSAARWTAGCGADCSGQPACGDAAAVAPCHLECCVAVTRASCLWLNGTLNHVAARAAGAAPSPLALGLLLTLGLLM